MGDDSPSRTGRGSEAQDLGQRVRGMRQRNRWSLAELANRSGMAASTLSRVENNQLSLTYEKLLGLSRGLGVDIADLLGEDPPNPETAAGRRTYTPPEGGRVVETDSYHYRYLCTDMRRKKMTPIIGEIRARTLEETGGFLRHQGEEVIYVLDGVLELHTEFYEPLRVEAGGCAYFDSSMGHAFVAAEGTVKMLSVCTTEEPVLVAIANQRTSAPERPRAPTRA